AVATYDYTDADGTLLHQVIRYEPKGFSQRQPDGKGGWINNLDGCRRVPYRLPELLKYPDAEVYHCEGEKDANRLAGLGLCTTTVVGGKMTDDCVKYFAGRNVVIIEDADRPGVHKALSTAQKLHGIANTIRVVRLPGHEHTADSRGKDVSDWLDEHPETTRDDLAAMCFDAPLWTPETATPVADAKTTAEPATDATPPLPWRRPDQSHADSEPIPEREWAILNRVPLRQAGLFSGEGGTGKSIIEITKNIAHVTGKDWLGSMPERGPAIYLGAEDDEKELHIRLAAIAKHYGVTFEELIAGGLHVLCLLGQDATLCAAAGK